MTVDAVVFDLGNVLVRWDPYLPFIGHMERAEVEALFDEIDFPALNHRLDAGRPWAEARAEVVRRYPHRADAFDFYREHFADSIPGPVDGSARLVRDPLLSLTCAIVASLIVLPVTWYHYPVALIPVAIAAWTRSRGMPQARRVSITLFVAWILADAAIALPVTTWIAMALVLVAVRMSRPFSSSTLGQVAPSVEDGPASGDAIDRVEVVSR